MLLTQIQYSWHFSPTPNFLLALTFLNLACFSILQFYFYCLIQRS